MTYGNETYDKMKVSCSVGISRPTPDRVTNITAMTIYDQMTLTGLTTITTEGFLKTKGLLNEKFSRDNAPITKQQMIGIYDIVKKKAAPREALVLDLVYNYQMERRIEEIVADGINPMYLIDTVEGEMNGGGSYFTNRVPNTRFVAVRNISAQPYHLCIGDLIVLKHRALRVPCETFVRTVARMFDAKGVLLERHDAIARIMYDESCERWLTGQIPNHEGCQGHCECIKQTYAQNRLDIHRKLRSSDFFNDTYWLRIIKRNGFEAIATHGSRTNTLLLLGYLAILGPRSLSNYRRWVSSQHRNHFGLAEMVWLYWQLADQKELDLTAVLNQFPVLNMASQFRNAGGALGWTEIGAQYFAEALNRGTKWMGALVRRFTMRSTAQILGFDIADIAQKFVDSMITAVMDKMPGQDSDFWTYLKMVRWLALTYLVAIAIQKTMIAAVAVKRAYQSFFGEETKTRAQVSDDVATLAVTSLLGICGYHGIFKTPVATIQAWSNLSRLQESGKKVFEAITAVVSSTINSVCEYFQADPIFNTAYGYRDVEEWIVRVRALAFNQEKPFVATEQSNTLFGLWNEGCDFKERFIKEKVEQRLIEVVNWHMRTLDSLRKICDSEQIYPNAPRIEPLCVYIFGHSGSGKSWITEPICAKVIQEAFGDEKMRQYNLNPGSVVYSRTAETGFWDGYLLQDLTVFDDLGQAKDDKDKDNEWMNLIRCCNRWSMLLHMAAVHQKGSRYFKSTFILCTGNHRQVNPTSVTCVEAVRRRFDFSFEIVPNPELCVKTENSGHQSYRFADNVKPHINNVMFQQYDHESGRQIGSLISFGEVMNKLLNGMESKKQAFTAARSMVDQALKLDLSVAEGSFVSAQGRFKQTRLVVDPMKEFVDDKFAFLSPQTRVMFRDVFSLETPDDINEWIETPLGNDRFLIDEITEDAEFIIDRKRFVNELYAHYIATCKSRYSRFLKGSKNLFEVGCAFISKGYFKLKKWKVLVFKVAGLALTIGGFFGLMSALMQKDEAQIYQPEEMKLSKYSQRQTPLVRIKAQMSAQTSDQAEKILNNHYSIKTSRVLGSLLVLENGIAIICGHFEKSLSGGFSIIDKSGQVIPVAEPKVVPSNLADVSFVYSRTFVGKSIWNVINRDYYNEGDEWEAYLLKADRNPNRSWLYTISTAPTVFNEVPFVYECTEEDNSKFDLTIFEWWQVSHTGYDGDCGNLLISNSPHHTGRLLGLHVAGGRDHSVFVSLRGLQKIPEVSTAQMRALNPIKGQPLREVLDWEFSDNFVFDRVSDRIMFRNTKSTITQSPIHGFRPVVKMPAQLRSFKRDGVWVDPLRLAICKKGRIQVNLDQTEVNVAVNQVFAHIVKVSSKPFFRQLTFEEAVKGSKSFYHIKSLDRSKSPGWPLTTQGFGNMHGIFGAGQEFDLTGTMAKDIERKVSDFLDVEKKFDPSLFVFTPNLKDETIKCSKVHEGKTRIVCGSPLVFTLAMKRVFGSFVHWMVKNRIVNGSAVGLNPFSDWAYVAKVFDTNRSRILCADQSESEVRIQSVVIRAIIKAICELTGVDERIRDRILECLCAPYYILFDVIFRILFDFPSGHYLTAIVNTLYYFVMTVLLHNRLRPYDDFFIYHKHLGCGDDTFNKSVKGYEFDVEEWSNAWLSVGHKITASDKTERLEYVTLENADFLKCGFGMVEFEGIEYVVPTLHADTISTMIQWVKSKRNKDTVFLSTLQEALLWASLHGEAFHKSLVMDIKKKSSLIFSPCFDYIACLRKLFTKRTSLMISIADTNVEVFGSDLLLQVQDSDLLRSTEQGAVLAAPIKPSQPPLAVVGCDSPCCETKSRAQMNTTNKNVQQAPEEEDAELGRTRECDDGYQVDNQSTTVMNDDGCVESVYAPGTGMAVVRSGDTEKPDIIRFLQKPVRIATGSISGVTTVGLVSSWLVPNALFSQQVMLEKLSGVYGIQSSFEITLQINSQVMQQGLLYLFSYPLPDYTSERYTETMRNLTLTTQVPGVVLDIGTQTEVKLTIPWSYFMNMYVLNNGTTNKDNTSQISLARVGLYLYSPLFTASGDTNIDYTIWARCIDPVIHHAAPGVGWYSAQSKSRAQMAGPIEKERPSQALSSVSVGLSGMSKVPLIGPLMSNMSWGAKILSGTLSHFGFSAPRLDTSMVRIYPQMNSYVNSDEPEPTQNLAVFRNAMTKTPKGVAPTMEDEMSIQHIVSKYAFLYTTTWSASTAVDTTLINTGVDPGAFNVGYTQLGQNLTAWTPLGYMTRMFNQWRGSVKFKFRIVGTQFHSGRLEIFFVPGQIVPTAAPTTDEAAYLQRTILDIGTSRVFEFEVPFISAKQFLYAGERSGTIFVKVLNKLRAPATVTQSVAIVMEVCGTDETEFSVPRVVNLPLLFAQGDTLGAIKDSTFDSEPAEIAIGESVRSLRSLIKRYEHHYSMKAPAAGDFFFAPIDMVLMSGISPTQNGFNYPQFWSLIAPMYAMNRGGIRMRIITNSFSAPVAIDWPQPQAARSGPLRNVASSTVDIKSISVATNSSVSNVLDHEFPFYSVFNANVNNYMYRILATGALTPSAFTAGKVEPLRFGMYGTQFNPAATDSITFLRAAAEDFSFFHFMGCPPTTANIAGTIASTMPWSSDITT